MEPLLKVRAGRAITGMSAVLLPHTEAGTIDWDAFEAHVSRTRDAGLVPAVNMDTGFVQLLTPAQRQEVLDRTAALVGDGFVAGAFVPDDEGAVFAPTALAAAGAAIADRGGIPIVFPSWGMSRLSEAEVIDALAGFGERVGRFLAFELGPMFVPNGRIYSLDAFASLLDIAECIGAKHSSLSRAAEWDRLTIRDERRPDFMVLTGNDLAIDMVMYGSDYLLGLSTFAPDLFARRDELWKTGDPAFYELNDTLQYLGQFAFRPVVPGYRHDAAMFLQLRGWCASDATPAGAARRPASDRAVLADIADRLGVLA